MTKGLAVANRFSKTLRAQQEILNLIARENMGMGDRLPPEKELEKTVGVSIITVRRALADLAERGVIERIQGKGTFLRRKSLASSSLGTIAFVLVDRPTSLYEELVEEARVAARRRRYGLDLVVTQASPDTATTGLLQGISGAVITGYVADEWIDLLDQMHIPHVVLGVHRLRRPTWTVKHDFPRAAGVLVDRLAARGCRRIGLVNGARRHLPCHELYDGFVDAMHRHGLAVSEQDVVWCRHDRRLADLAQFADATELDFDALIVEHGCLRPLLLFLYDRQPAVTPVLGLISESPDPTCGLSRFAAVAFGMLPGEAAVDLLFEAMSSDESERRTVLIPPITEAVRPSLG